MIGNFAFLLVFLLLAGLLLRVRSAKLHKFWGTRPGALVNVVVSHFKLPYGSVHNWQNQLLTFSGSSVPLLEAECASLIKRVFLSPLPGREHMPKPLADALMPAVEAVVSASPDSTFTTTAACVVTLGGPGYNSASDHVSSLCSAVLQWGNGSGFTTPLGLVPRPDRSFIVRIRKDGQTFYWAAGITEAGTAASALHLAREWRQLHRLFGGSNFFAVLAFQPHDYTSAHIIGQGTF